MDAIKKKMQAMKLEKDNAMDRALMCEQQAKDANLRAEKVKIMLKSLSTMNMCNFDVHPSLWKCCIAFDAHRRLGY